MRKRGPFPNDAFEWPAEMTQALRSHIQRALMRLRVSGYEQEPAYVAALIARLDGVVYEGTLGRIELIGTIVADRGARSAERKWGADFSITASLKQATRKAKKGILGQAKRGGIQQLPPGERQHLDDQSKRMLSATPHCVILETPLEEDTPPFIRIVGRKDGAAMTLDDYLIGHFMTCIHGDKREEFVENAMVSRLDNLHVVAETPFKQQ